jgi:hypothetical protein
VRELHPHTPEECFADGARSSQNQARVAAHEAYVAASRIIGLLDETAEPAWIELATALREHAWLLHQELVHATAW